MPKTFVTIEFAYFGGNQLRAWVLSYFGIVGICFDWFLGCFVKFIRHLEHVSGSCYVEKMKDNL